MFKVLKEITSHQDVKISKQDMLALLRKYDATHSKHMGHFLHK